MLNNACKGDRLLLTRYRHFSSRNTCCLYLLVPKSSLQGFLKYTLRIRGHVVRYDIMLSEGAVQQSTAPAAYRNTAASVTRRWNNRRNDPQPPSTRPSPRPLRSANRASVDRQDASDTLNSIQDRSRPTSSRRSHNRTVHPHTASQV